MNQNKHYNKDLNKGAKQVFLLISLLFATTSFAQVQTQKGVSYRYNGKNPRTPLPNVVIKYDIERQPAISDSMGAFELTFSNLKMGDRIGLVTVTKREMMVFNQHAVDEWSIRKEPLCLILCDADEFDRQKKEYMDLGRKDAKRKYDRQKAELEKQLEEGKIKQEDLENALNVAYERLKKLQEEIDKYADDLARIDLSELDGKMQEILEMYQRGETEEAIERLKSLKLAEEFDKETAHYEAVQQELQRSDSKIQMLVEQMKNSVALLMNSGEWEEAGKYLKRLADKVNTLGALDEYAFFCSNQNNHQEAIDYYNRALYLIDEDAHKDSIEYKNKRAALLNNLATLYKDTQHHTESEALYIEVLETYRRLAEANPYAYEHYVAITLNNLGLLYSHTRRLAESEAAYQEALGIYRRLAKDTPQVYEHYVAMTLNNLANLYSDTQRHTESEALYLEALVIRRRLAEANPQAYEPDLAMMLNNLALLYSDTQRYTESEALYIEVLETYRRLAEANPQAYEPDLARTLNNLANIYSDTQRYTESEALYIEVLETYRRLAEATPQAYEPDLARTLFNLSNLYYSAQRHTESEVLYLEALEIQKRLAVANPQAYKPDVAGTLNNLALLYSDIQHYTESEAMYVEALETYRCLAETTPQAYEPDLARTLFNLSNLYYSAQRYSESEVLYLEALEIQRRLAEANPHAFKPDVARTLFNISILYYYTQRYSESLTLYLETLEIYRCLAQANPQTYEPDVAQSLYNIGLLHIQQEQYNNAIADYEECLPIYRRLAQNNSDYGNLYFSSLYWLTQLYPTAKEHTKCFEVNEEALLLLKSRYQEGVENYQEAYVKVLGNQSFQCIFVGQLEKSEQYAIEALTIDPLQQWIFANLAVAQLFQGKYAEAEEIYRLFKNDLKDIFLQNLQDFETSGVIPKNSKADVEKIRRMLNE